jgi:hypothetical protein
MRIVTESTKTVRFYNLAEATVVVESETKSGMAALESVPLGSG